MNKKIFSFGFIYLLLPVMIHAQVGGESKGWPSVERYSFLKECINSAQAGGLSTDSARYYCWCMQDRVETKYPTIEEASTITETQMSSPEWQRDIKACLAGTWGASDREEFLSSCIETAKASIGEEKAKIYCECMLYKTESRYPNYADANKLTEKDLSTPAFKKLIDDCIRF